MKRETTYLAASIALCFATAGCGNKAGGGESGAGHSKWLDAKLKPTTVEAKGTKVTVDIPEGLPENKESLVGPDWMVPIGEAGPRIHVESVTRTYKSPDDLARDVEPDAKRLDLVEVNKQALANGRLQYISQTNGGKHLDVAVWIPLDETHGIQASCHWYAGSDAKAPANPPPPDPKLVAWLSKICDSINVVK